MAIVGGQIMIRATRGHSNNAPLPPNQIEVGTVGQQWLAAHATDAEVIPEILRAGLRRMRRNNVHMAPLVPADYRSRNAAYDTVARSSNHHYH